jgi:hypothetical protein
MVCSAAYAASVSALAQNYTGIGPKRCTVAAAQAI